jgi:soluble lytic murein transglycosylase-like protein
MHYIFRATTRQLLQRFSAVGATSVTFFALIAVPAAAQAAAPLAAEQSLTLYSPVAGIDMPSTPVGPDDVLDRLRRGFELTYEDNNRTAAELKWFVKHPDYLNRVFTRAQRYLPYILAELERRDMPLELALLPIVESAYDPFAYSHGRAAGLWQMIPGTAKRFGIKQNWWYDGRRDVVDSTRAALDYLEYLEDLNDGRQGNRLLVPQAAQRNQHVRTQAAGTRRDCRGSREVQPDVARGTERAAVRCHRY